MGNVLGRAAQAPQWEPNIPREIQQQNNPNLPYQEQMRAMVLQYAVPMLCLSVFAYIQQKQQRERAVLLQQHELELDVQKNHLQAQYRDAVHNQSVMTSTMQATISNVEEKEAKRAAKRKKDLDVVDEYLERILDIRCSLFKDHKRRERLQDELVVKRETLHLADIVSYKELREIFKHDGQFCGKKRQDNGKLRQLYMQQWRLKVDVDQAQSVLMKLKNSNR